MNENQGLLAGQDRCRKLKQESVDLPSWDLTFRQVCDLELLLNGGFSPLSGYLTRADHEGVCQEMRLADGRLWPIPITLDVTQSFGREISEGDRIALRHPEGIVLAILTVQEAWEPDLMAEAKAVFRTDHEDHPGVSYLLHESNPFYVGGSLEGVELPPHHTFKHLRHTPSELRGEFRRLGWKRIVAFQTRNPMHRAHVELTRRAAAHNEANLLIHPVVGRTSPGDLDYFARVNCYRAVMRHAPPGASMLSLLPLAMRMAGPREAVWHALIRKNYGCTHFIVGRDHAGPRKKTGEPFYDPDEARALAVRHAAEIGLEIVPFEEMVYYEDGGDYRPRSDVPAGGRILSLSGTDLRRRLRQGHQIPEWFSYPEVIRELRKRYPPRSRQGYTVFFTGLSGAGKSTIANILMAKLMEIDNRPVTLLDGDIVRKNLSSELGFSKEHRVLNIRRIGFVAGEITKNRGVAICAPIAPYARTRRAVRQLIGMYGGFAEIYVSTPLEVCEKRDRKGLYAKARSGLIKEFTGIDDPYEAPESPELSIDTAGLSAEEAAHRIVLFLEHQGYIAASQPQSGGAEESAT
ncbi:MAG: bifunctional sulfate adenylyltransferase/adenylylsulfate kinase [Acidobacteriota bacterium]